MSSRLRALEKGNHLRLIFIKELLMKVKTFYNVNDKVSNPTEKWGKRWKVSQSLNLIKKFEFNKKSPNYFLLYLWMKKSSHPFLYISSFTDFTEWVVEMWKFNLGKWLGFCRKMEMEIHTAQQKGLYSVEVDTFWLLNPLI